MDTEAVSVRLGKLLHEYFLNKNNSHKIATIYDDGKDGAKLLTYQEIYELVGVIEPKIQNLAAASFIGLSVEKNHVFPAFQISIMQAGKAVFNIPNEDLSKTIESICKVIPLLDILIDESTYVKHKEWIVVNSEVETCFELVVCEDLLKFHLVTLSKTKRFGTVNLESQTPRPFEFAYVMQTTGTTGKRKTVLVPHESIIPNINDFIDELWSCQKSDVIFGSSPTTFDPSIVELFTAFGSGASILYVPNSIKMDGKKLGKIFKKHKVTIFPTTPSLLRKIGKDLKNEEIFSPNYSSLKVISIGGEKCISKEELMKLISPEMDQSLRSVINVYGVTEVSCWASFCKIKLYEEGDISIGKAMKDTYLMIDYSKSIESILGYRAGEILIVSPTRICTVINENGQIVNGAKNVKEMLMEEPYKIEFDDSHYYRTGDYGYYDQSCKLKFFGRVDDIVKRSGMKVPLQVINEAAMESGSIQIAQCTFWEDRIYLLIVPNSNSQKFLGLKRSIKAEFIPEFKLNLVPAFYPDYIIALHSIPVNENGKVDMKRIINSIQNHTWPYSVTYNIPPNVVEEIMVRLWSQVLPENINIHQMRKNNFFEMGGKSLDATWVIENIFQSLKLIGTRIHTENENRLLNLMFAYKFRRVLAELFEILTNKPISASITSVCADSLSVYKEKSGTWMDELIFLEPDEHQNVMIKLQKSIYLSEKRHLLSFPTSIIPYSYPLRTFASFKYDLRMCIDAKAAVALSDLNKGLVIIGSHSGHVAAIKIYELYMEILSNPGMICKNVGLLWCIVLPDRVEAEVTFNKECSIVYVGCHDRKLYKVSAVNGHILASFTCSGAIRSKPNLSERGDFLVIVDDMNTIYCMETKNLNLIWRRLINDGIISTNQIIVNSELVILTIIRQGLTSFGLKNGSKIWPSSNGSLNGCISTTFPIIVNLNDGERAVITGTDYGVGCQSLYTGIVIWNYKELTIVEHLCPPMVHHCEFLCLIEILMITKYGRVVILNSFGEKLQEIYICESLCAPLVLCNPIIPIRSQPFKNKRHTNCYLICKRSTGKELIAHQISRDFGVKEVTCTSHTVDQESFSSPINLNNCLIFGARDNKVHIIFCK